jgi:hypothetical protein
VALHGGRFARRARLPDGQISGEIARRLTNQSGPSVHGSWPQPEKGGGRCLE